MKSGWKRWVRRGMWAGLGLGAAVAGVLGVGAVLPVEHTATVADTVPAQPVEVWAAITDVEGFASWRSDVDRAERLPDREGRPGWREAGPTGALTMEVVRREEPSLLVTRIADEGLPFGGTWTYRLDPVPDGTRVTLVEDGEVYDPFFRVMSRFVFGHEGTMRRYLDDLALRMESSAEGGS